MSRPSLSRSYRKGLIALAFLLLANAFAFRAVADENCEPFAEPYPAAGTRAAPASHEGGIVPSASAPAQGSAKASGPGAIVPLPVSAGRGAPAVGGEVLLALPKRPDGSMPTNFQLGPGVTVAEHYWSPVLCATIARLVGPPGATVAEIVPRVPPGAAAARHDRYSTAGVALRAAPALPAQTTATAQAEEPDPYRSLQYGLDRLGADAASRVSRGAGVKIGILDSAPQVSHRDLSAVEVATVDGGPTGEPAAHGTLMAGVVRAVARNGFGIAGVAPAAQVIAVPVCTPTGAGASDECRLYDVLRGLDLAWNQGATVLNLSLVGPDNPLLERAVARLEKLGALVVAAAGNEGTTEARYPAAYASVIGVDRATAVPRGRACRGARGLRRAAGAAA
ncbi:MAG TPA: S8 family serine peptidase, partial [Myxococcota bacterium]|nr:S8 family serine peptidase [Myxococcota bacterium]